MPNYAFLYSLPGSGIPYPYIRIRIKIEQLERTLGLSTVVLINIVLSAFVKALT